jgi:ABC-type branched-subunit amino acid transport system ATPase component
MKYAQLVVGPAGSGKSTFCETVKQFCDASGGRPLHVVNLGAFKTSSSCLLSFNGSSGSC